MECLCRPCRRRLPDRSPGPQSGLTVHLRIVPPSCSPDLLRLDDEANHGMGCRRRNPRKASCTGRRGRGARLSAWSRRQGIEGSGGSGCEGMAATAVHARIDVVARERAGWGVHVEPRVPRITTTRPMLYMASLSSHEDRWDKIKNRAKEQGGAGGPSRGRSMRRLRGLPQHALCRDMGAWLVPKGTFAISSSCICSVQVVFRP